MASKSVTPAIKPVAVKTLTEFCAKSGSLDRGFTPAPSALQGMEGHKVVTRRRSEDYQTEISLSINSQGLFIRGRADGYDPKQQCLEEIKTFYGDFAKLPENHRALHWAQAKVYAWMLTAQRKLEHIKIALVYFHLDEQKEYRLEQDFSAQELHDFGSGLARCYQQWQEQINHRQQQLNQWIDHLSFPHGEFRQSQRHMAEAVYKAAATGRVVLAEAPTGTGKTLASLFPAIKALKTTSVDKIFYLTAKTTGKNLALENVRLITTESPSTPLRILELTAQEKICLEPDKRCAGDSCPFARGFYDKLPGARQAASEIPLLDKTALVQLAHQYQLCPFYLGMEMSRWTDIVVADFNYYFDGSALLLGLTREFNWRPFLLVDEAHNLLDRGRQMYSAVLDRGALLAAKRHAPKSIKKNLDRANKVWLEILEHLDASASELILLEEVPEQLSLALGKFSSHYLEFLQQQPEHPIQHTVTHQFFFDVLNYQTKMDMLGDDYVIDMQTSNPRQEILTLRNVIPARLLAERLAFAQAACFFSATLKPAHFYRELLGLPKDTVCLEVPSPFNADQLKVNIARSLSTRFHDRSAAIKPICAIIEQQLIQHPGNYLAFFPSYEFLQQVEEQLKQQLVAQDIHLISQSRRMSEKDREDFITAFNRHNNLLGLAVLGGVFSEGIDLPGDALKGAFIATLGLPQFNPVNDNMRARLEAIYQQGYNFTYLYPGIQKVVQAAGRVIRTQNDTGYVWLLDERFAHTEIKKLLPGWWQLDEIS